MFSGKYQRTSKPVANRRVFEIQLLPPNSADTFLLNYIEAKDGLSRRSRSRFLAKAERQLSSRTRRKGIGGLSSARASRSRDSGYVRSARSFAYARQRRPIEVADEKHASGATWSVVIAPAKQSDAQYVAFHIAGAPEKEVRQDAGAKNGVSIALTALDANAP